MLRLAFLHIPKTGGTTFNSLVSRYYRRDQIFPWHHSRLDLWPLTELKGYDYFWGHFALSDIQHLGLEVKSVTLLRRPVDRIVSLYYYWKSLSSEALPPEEVSHARAVRQLSLRDFIRERRPSLRLAIDNAVVQAFIPYPLRGRNSRFAASEKIIIGDALENLSKFSAFGITERFAETLELFNSALGTRLVPPLVKLRARSELENNAEEDISPDMRADLNELTSLDEAFFNEASKLFDAAIKATRERMPIEAPTALEKEYLYFGQSYFPNTMLGVGWSEPEIWGVWSTQNVCELLLRLQIEHVGGLRLTFDVRSPVCDAERKQTVRVRIGSNHVSTWVFETESSEPSNKRIVVVDSAWISSVGALSIQFEIDKLINHRALGLSSDDRDLGFGLEAMQIETLDDI